MVIAVMSVVMMVALPTWRHQVQREKEAELIFRGEQYARAIGLYQRKHPGAFPASLDVLVEQKYLRKKYKDPITGEDFVPVYANEVTASAAITQRPGAGMPPNRIKIEPRGPDGRGELRFTVTRQTAGLAGGIVGVTSKSTAQSIRLYNGRDRYDQWVFTYTAASPEAGVSDAPAAQQPDGPRQPDSSSRPGLPQGGSSRGRGRGGQ